MQNWTPDRLVTLFQSARTAPPRAAWRDYVFLSTLLNEELITVEEQSIRPTPRPTESIDECRRYASAFDGPGSEWHGELKWWAYNWLRTAGEQAPVYEAALSYGRADVWAPILRIAVECGETSPCSVPCALHSGCGALALVPFDLEVIYIFRLTEPVGLALEDDLFRDNAAALVGL